MQMPGSPMPQPMPGGAPSPQPGGAPPPAGAMPGGQGGDPKAAVMQHVDKNNPLQMLLLKRLDGLAPPDVEALLSMPPQAAEALKKVLPEVGFMIDMMLLGRDPSGQAEMAPSAMQGMQPMAGANQPQQMSPAGGSRLSMLQA